MKLVGVGVVWLGAIALWISDVVQDQIVKSLEAVMIVALPALFLYLTQRLNHIKTIVEDTATKVDGLSSRREEQLKAAEIDAAAKGGELKAHEEAKKEEKK